MIKVLAAESQSQKKSGVEAFEILEIFLAALPLVAALLPNLT